MEVGYQLTEEDYLRAASVWRRMRWWRRLSVTLAFLIVALAVLGSSTQAILYPSAGNYVLVIAMIGVGALVWLSPRLSARKQFRSMPSAHAPLTLTVAESGMQVHCEHYDSTLSWSTYIGWSEGQSVFVLLPQPRIYIPIPKRAFNQEQLAEFREILKRNIGKKSRTSEIQSATG
jgi:hypothetical protein